MGAQTDRALILRRHPYSESSLVVSALTREHGLLQVLARGAYRPRSAFYCVLDLFHELQLEWQPSSRTDLANLRKAELVLRRQAITRDLQAFHCATCLLELTQLGARSAHRERRLFDLLSRSLEQLCVPSHDANRVRIEFELGFLQLHGLFPALERCAGCAAPAPARGRPARVGFSAGAGGRLCESCAAQTRAEGGRVGTLPLDVLEFAAGLARGDAPTTTPELLLRARDFLERFLDYHLGTRPRSYRTFLAGENRNALPTAGAEG